MGWAARANISAGNPTVPALKARYIDARWLATLKERNLPFTAVKFSDRAYAVDCTTGQLRRLPPDAK